MEYYKIRNTITGQYSKGGSIPYFDKHGKIWRAIGPVKSHLRLVQQTVKTLDAYKDCEIVIWVQSPNAFKTPLTEIIDVMEKEMIMKKLKGTA